MALTIDTVVQNIWTGDYYRSTYPNVSVHDLMISSYRLDVDVTDEFELPVAMMPSAYNNSRDVLKPNTILAQILTNRNTGFGYVNVEKEILAAIDNPFSQTVGVCKIVDKKKPGSPIYYASKGLIMDEEFNVLMIATWMVKWINSEGSDAYVLHTPKLRIEPSCFTRETDSTLKFICNKMLKKCAGQCVHPNQNFPFINGWSERHLVSIRIEEIPEHLQVHHAKTPDITTSNEELRQLVLNNLQDLDL